MNKILEKFPEMREALNKEISVLKKTKQEIPLFEGEFLKKIDDNFIYRFEIPEGKFIRMVEEVEIIIGKEKVKGEIVSVDNQYIIIKLPIDYGNSIKQITISLQSDMIYRKLLERLATIFDEEKKFNIQTTEKLFYPISISNSDEWTNKIVYAFKGDSDKNEFNETQKKAIRGALNNRITFIWGPPGTGKTKVLGAIAFNLIKSGKRVLFSSNTNRAVDNGIIAIINSYESQNEEYNKEITRYGQIALIDDDKLHSVSFDRQVAYLREEKRKKVQKKIELLDSYRNFMQQIEYLEKQLNRFNQLNSQIKHIEQELSIIPTQLIELKAKIDRFDEASFVSKIKQIFTGEKKENLIAQFSELQEKERKIKNSLIEKKKELGIYINISQNFSNIKQQFEPIKDEVDKCGGEEELADEIENESMIDEGALLSEKSLIGATLAKLVTNEVFWQIRFDALIVDEGSMANLPYLAALSALTNEKVIIGGDPQQLPPIAMTKDPDSQKWLQKDIYMFASNRKSIDELFSWNENNQALSAFLDIQYRMPPNLCKFISNFFYHNRLMNGKKEDGKIVFLDTSPLHPVTKQLEGKKFLPYNPVHTAKIIEFIKYAIVQKKFKPVNIGIILPFRGSVDYVRNQLKVNNFRNIEVGTIYTFQGREKPVIIFDTVMAGVDYTVKMFDENLISEDEVRRLMNVALSRAEEDIWIIACMNHFRLKYENKFILRLLQELEKISE